MSEMMNQGFMQKMKGKVQSVWGDITDDDIQKAQGNKDQLVGTIKEKTGQSEEEIRRRLDELERDAA